MVNGTETIDTGYHYNSFGSVDTTTLYKNYGSVTSLPSGATTTFTTSYDNDLLTYATSSTNPLGQTTQTSYDYGLGLPLTVTDPNNNTTTTAYDGLGRVTSVKYPGYTQANVKYTYPTAAGSPLAVTAPFSLKMEVWDESPVTQVYRQSWQIMDGLGRTIQTQGPYETAGSLVLGDTAYDARGKTLYSGLPRTQVGAGGSYYAPSWANVPHSTSSYDELGRSISVAYADGTSEKSSYSYLSTTFTDRNSHQKVQENDIFGRMVKVEEYTGTNPYTLYATTNYLYDEKDQLKQITDAAGNLTTISYDGFGRKTSLTDPDLGNWRYRYDASGNLVAQIDANRQAINMFYDDLNRLKGKTYTPNVNPDTYQAPADPLSGYIETYVYDVGVNGVGHRTSMSNEYSSTSWTYNELGQPTNETVSLGGIDHVDGVYEIDSTFDALEPV